MAKIVAIRCPECGAKTNMDYDQKRCFCTYCGTELIFDDGSKTISYNATYRRIDEARITESENLKELAFRQYEEQNKNDRVRLIVSAIVVVSWLISLIVLVLVNVISGHGDIDNQYLFLIALDIILGLIMITVFFKGNKKKNQ